jgi:hypothetical protein
VKGLLLLGIAMTAPSITMADEALPSASTYGEHRHRPKSELGISVSAGGGVSRFTSEEMRSTLTADVHAQWDLRLVLGSRSRLGLEAGISITTARVHPSPTSDTAPLVGLTDEVAVRLNIIPHGDVNPYAFAGVGWQHFDVLAEELDGSTMEQDDTTMTIPLGVGATYRDPGGPLLDLRGTFRATTFQNLVRKNAGSAGYAAMHSWTASASVGYEF